MPIHSFSGPFGRIFFYEEYFMIKNNSKIKPEDPALITVLKSVAFWYFSIISSVVAINI